MTGRLSATTEDIRLDRDADDDLEPLDLHDSPTAQPN
jgi:hypothetical protein